MYTKAIKSNNCCECSSTQEGDEKKMTKKEHIKMCEMIAALHISYFACYVLYDIEYSINDYAYITYETDRGIQSYHRLMIYSTKDGSAFVRLHGKRLHLAEFN